MVEPNWAEATMAIVSVLTLVAIILAGLQVLNVNRQMHREFEMQYLQRFWSIIDQFSEDFHLKGKATKNDEIFIELYIQLCEDQISLRGLARVTDHTWDFWRKDITKMCGQQDIKNHIDKIDPKDYPELISLLGTPGYDPLDMTLGKKILKGL